MPQYNVYRFVSRGRVKKGVIRVWSGEARDETQAVVRASQASPALVARMALFARAADDDPYKDHAIIEEQP